MTNQLTPIDFQGYIEGCPQRDLEKHYIISIKPHNFETPPFGYDIGSEIIGYSHGSRPPACDGYGSGDYPYCGEEDGYGQKMRFLF